MKVLVVGSGGREHAIVWKLAQSPLAVRLYCAPGNAGMSQHAELVPIEPNDLAGLLKFAKREAVDLTVVGPEAPLAAGIVDLFQAENLPIFGPDRVAAQLESSKVFSKEWMRRAGIPTAAFRVFEDAAEAKRSLLAGEPPFVIKAEGLAGGKGVVVAETAQEAVQAITDIQEKRVFGDAGKRVVIEKHLTGEEVSILVLADGTRALALASSQDHKRAGDGDTGPNTGGMGAYSPCPSVPDGKVERLVDLTIMPLLEALRKEGIVYRGLLYAGLMLTRDGPFVLEYNVRFGDPEAQAVIPRLKSDLLPILDQIAHGRLSEKALLWDERACLSVVAASGGYPGHYETGLVIAGLERLKSRRDLFVFHAGTRLAEGGRVVTAGGRVLAVSALAPTLKEAQEKAYAAVGEVYFQGMHVRRDIGWRALGTQAVKSPRGTLT